LSVTLTINDRTVQAGPGPSLFDHAREAGVHVPNSCAQQGRCRECLVEIAEGAECLSPPTAAEQHLREGFRLSCRAHLVGDTGHVRCHTMRRGHFRVERRATGLPGTTPALDPAVGRSGDRVLLDGEDVGPFMGAILGLAIDVGTTTVVLRLHDLQTGELIADTSFENPQRFGGSDVMARIHYDTSHSGRLLMRTLAAYLRHAIDGLPADPATIYEAVVVGNSTMRDLFFRRSVYSIGQAPYQSITEIERHAGRRAGTSLVEPAARCLLRLHPRARVYGAPLVSGHVGADAAACMLAVGLAHEARLVAVMDIGTNTELVVGNRDRIVAASCPAGPAFEGGGIRCGMPALDGAIERVTIDAEGTFRCSTIEDAPAQGICGSGLIDLLSELRRTGRMNELGRFEHDGGWITLDAEREIVFGERDVNELAQAKGANAAGLHVVFGARGIDFADLDVFYLAGGFGRHIDVGAAQRIGLVPCFERAEIVQVGNAAIEGASMALLSVTRRRELERLVASVELCRLETHPQFFDLFVEGCHFRPMRAVRGGAS
jgi:uncharacterized 2Fe-2S/4Fe-4S cluster protein (DUF4445 family)